MRRLAVALLIALAAVGVAQRREGSYRNVAWRINEHHTLIWGGQPYLPVGVAVPGNPGSLEAPKQAGIKDFLVDLPANAQAGWADTLPALEAMGARYLIRINSLAPMAEGFAIEPQGYRVTGIDQPRRVELELPGAKSAYVVLAAKRDGSIAASERVPVKNGRLVYEAKPGPSYEHVLLIYPEMVSMEQPDFWGGLDCHRDTLLATLQRHAPGAGLRGIVNPLGRTVDLPGRQIRFVPTNPYFRMELRNQLEQRYKSVQTAQRSWSMAANDLETFDQLARLVPLWSADRGVPFLLDPVTDKLYQIDRRFSNAWSDIAQVIALAAAKRFDRLVAAIRSVADVPVIQEWAGWATPYETATPALDGLGMRASGTTPSAIAESVARATSSILRWSTRGWLLATDIETTATDAQQLRLVTDDLAALGARGFFMRAETPPLLAALAQEAAARATDAALPTLSPSAVFYPENATNPAHPQRLSGGRWWLPTPADGNRLDLGSQFFGYRTADRTVLWAKTPGRYKLRMTDPRKATFSSIDGTDPAAKLVKGGVEVTIGQFPLTITGTSEVPVPENAFTETIQQFDSMMVVAEQALRDITEERVLFRELLDGFERNPGANFEGMRHQVYRLSYKVGRHVWLEAEKSADTNFSEAALLPGASGAHALFLDSRVPPGPEGYYAEFTIPVRTPEEQTVWVAARVPAERRKSLSVSVGGQLMRWPEEPTTTYGQGLQWFKVGTTRLAGTTTKLRIMVDSAGAEVAIDAILLTPDGFQPSGVAQPIATSVGTSSEVRSASSKS